MLRIQTKKYAGNPILTPRLEAGSFEKACVYNPAAIVKDNKVYLLYRAEEQFYDKYVSRIGLAVSEDGFHFERFSQNPVMDFDKDWNEENRGCEDPRVIQVGKRYFMTYTAMMNHHIDILAGAFSDNLIHWQKIKRLVPGREKAGAIIQKYKYKNKYVMYFGEGIVKVAFSENLKRWSVQEKPVLKPRKGYFDSFLVEGGPPPIVVDEGILMIYNSATAGESHDHKRKEWISYQPGYAIFDKENPTRLLYRSDKPILQPTEYWERYGKVNSVIFTNGLVNFKNKWLLYYGGADKSIGVAELKLRNS